MEYLVGQRKLLLSMAIVVLHVILGGPTHAEDIHHRININIPKTVVRIVATTGTNGQTETGTGFLVCRHIGGTATTNRWTFLVTNKHMIGDWNLADGNISNYFSSLDIWFYQTDGNAKRFYLKDNSGKLKFFVLTHPNPQVDIAIIALLGDLDVAHQGKVLDSNSCLRRFNHIEPLGLGDQVFALGYPRGIFSLNNNYPLAKAGYLSSFPGEEFRIQLNTINRQGHLTPINFRSKVYLVDGLLVPGNSGGPVILPSEIKFRLDPKTGELQHSVTESDNSVIGLMSMILTEAGLSIVYSSDYISELLDLFESKIVRFGDGGVYFK